MVKQTRFGSTVGTKQRPLVRRMALILEEFRDIDATRACFDPLFEATGKVGLFYSYDWFSLLESAGIATGADVLILGVRDHGVPVALLPLLRRGPLVTGYGNFYTPTFTPLVNPACAPETLAEAWSQIAATLAQKGLASIRLQPLEPDNTNIEALAAAFAANGFAIGGYRAATRHFAATAGITDDAYAAALPSRLRHTIERRTGADDRQHDFRLFTGQDGVTEGMDHYQSVYARSWKTPEPFPAFMPGLARLCAERDALRLGVWFVDSDAAAVQFWIVENGHASIYKLAHDTAYDRYSVGTALTLRMFQAILDRDRPARIDFGLGDEAYKTDWTPHQEQLVGLVAFNKRSLRGQLQHLRHAASRLIKR